MTIEVIIKTDMETGEKTLHSAHHFGKAESFLFQQFPDVTYVEDGVWQTALFRLEIEETYLFEGYTDSHNQAKLAQLDIESSESKSGMIPTD